MQLTNLLQLLLQHCRLLCNVQTFWGNRNVACILCLHGNIAYIASRELAIEVDRNNSDSELERKLQAQSRKKEAQCTYHKRIVLVFLPFFTILLNLLAKITLVPQERLQQPE